ncbi:MAG: EamA family transporter RarD [Litorilinea sp.]
MNRGVVLALGAYILWGFSPLFWKLLTHIPAIQTTAHRVVWAFVLAAVVISFQGGWQRIRHALRHPVTVLTFIATGVLLIINWVVYVYAVNSQQVLATSLGYFIYPLFNVMLGVVVLHERLRPGQWLSVGIAAIGVAYITLSYGGVPWIALALPLSFGFYGLLRKVARLDSIQGLTVEMAFMTPIVLIFLLVTARNPALAQPVGIWEIGLFILGGAVTAVPLLLFSAGARMVPLTAVGLFQYLAPTIQFVMSIYLFNEPFDITQFVGFCIVWFALAIFIGEGIVTKRRIALTYPT